MRFIRHSVFIVTTLFLMACGTNPVTGKRELQFISEAQEIKIGQQNYAPYRQAQGGDYVVDEEVARYVSDVGQRVAAVADRKLPYEFEVLNSSVPNAWALPGGKIAINRGLLTELNSEAELAAVLGHEVVHAAARHGAKAQERGMFIQGGLIATQIATADNRNRNLIAGGAMIGAQLLMTRHGRGAELESDRYGMEYMKRAGYNPEAAVDLQETFVRLSEGRQTSWLEGLFASHPPSAERVAQNKRTAEALGAEGEYGRDSYQKAISSLVRDADAYKAHDDALKAAKDGQFEQADALTDKAIKLQPREAKFHGLKGDLALNDKQYKTALKHYDDAIARYPDYFAFHLRSGQAKKQLGDRVGAKASFEKSLTLLPTPTAHNELGEISLSEGNRQQALQHFQVAAQSNSEIGKRAGVSATRLDLPSNPSKYIKTQVRQDEEGRVVILVGNQAPVAVRDVRVAAAVVDAYGRQVSKTQTFRVRGTIEPQKAAVVRTRFDTPEGLKAQVQQAQVAD